MGPSWQDRGRTDVEEARQRLPDPTSLECSGPPLRGLERKADVDWQVPGHARAKQVLQNPVGQ